MVRERTPAPKRTRTEISKEGRGKSSRKRLSETFVMKKELARLEEKVEDVIFLQEILYKKLLSKELGVSFEDVEISSKPSGVIIDESSSVGETPAVGTPYLVTGSDKVADTMEIILKLLICAKTPRNVVNQILEGKGKFILTPKIDFAPTSSRMPPPIGSQRQKFSRIAEILQSSSSSSSTSSLSSSRDAST